MIEEVKMAFGENWYFFILLIALVIGIVCFKKERKLLFIPAILISIIILNPIFYSIWYRVNSSGYWRALWIIPLIPICAFIPSYVIEKIKKSWVKAIFLELVIALFVLCGVLVYNGEQTSFEQAGNADKLPKNVVKVANTLLDLEEEPYVVSDTSISIYLRQYSGKIKSLYARDVIFEGANSSLARNVYENLSKQDGDLQYVAQSMLNNDYKYLITWNKENEEQLNKAGFELVQQINGYGIYRVTGERTELKTYNDLHQVTSITTIDKDGHPINNSDGYASISFSYSNNGKRVRAFRTDQNGDAAIDRDGNAGYEAELDDLSNVVMQFGLDAEGNPNPTPQGYAIVKRAYNGRYKIKEEYYDADGNKTNRRDTLYASQVLSYDNNFHVIQEQYFDANDNPVISSFGYASVRREYKSNRVIKESYYGTDNQPITITAGYASLSRQYDEDGFLSSESYYDEKGELTNCRKGYAKEERVYDSEGNMLVQGFLDSEDQPVVVQSYATVYRIYDDNDRLVKEEYYGKDNEPLLQPAGYVAIEQQFDENGSLVTRNYLDIDGDLTARTDEYAIASWNYLDKADRTFRILDEDGNELPLNHINLVKDVHIDQDGWSEWMTPASNAFNCCFNIGTACLGNQKEGDLYTCQFEIEFKDVKATDGLTFRFWTQGAQDGKWGHGSIWNGNLINMYEPPENGIHRINYTQVITNDMVGISEFDLGFRCDYWTSGSFRVRNVKVEQGTEATPWTPGI